MPACDDKNSRSKINRDRVYYSEIFTGEWKPTDREQWLGDAVIESGILDRMQQIVAVKGESNRIRRVDN